MKTLIHAAIVATVLSTPAFSFAQSNNPLTRAQVRAELVELERAGYHVGDDDPHYPDAIQAAEAHVAAQHAIFDAYGGIRNQSSVSGAPVTDPAQADPKRLYRGR